MPLYQSLCARIWTPHLPYTTLWKQVPLTMIMQPLSVLQHSIFLFLRLYLGCLLQQIGNSEESHSWVWLRANPSSVGANSFPAALSLVGHPPADFRHQIGYGLSTQLSWHQSLSLQWEHLNSPKLDMDPMLEHHKTGSLFPSDLRIRVCVKTRCWKHN
jgi:hypothetical protein